MSVFKVSLNNPHQGYLDIDPRTQSINHSAVDSPGTQFSTSIQRTIYVNGPRGSFRKLFDGQTFTDCNWWKRFAYPQLPLDQAFLSVLSDDGSEYTDGVAEQGGTPGVYNLTIDAGSVYADEENVIDFLTDAGGAAKFVQITNNGSQSVKVRMNGNANAIFDLAGSVTQVFNSGDLSITKLEFQNNTSGAAQTTVQVISSVAATCSS